MRRVVALSTVVVVLALAGCFPFGGRPVVQRPDPRPTSAVTPAPPATAGTAAECPDDVARIDAPGVYELGDCASVEVDGTDITVHTGDVDTLAIHGDRVVVQGDAVGSVDVEGNDDVVGADTVGSATIRGDRNALGIAGGLGALTIGGNDNTVQADPVGAVDIAGDRNQVGP